jgi:hypothetical protein
MTGTLISLVYYTSSYYSTEKDYISGKPDISIRHLFGDRLEETTSGTTAKVYWSYLEETGMG